MKRIFTIAVLAMGYLFAGEVSAAIAQPQNFADTAYDLAAETVAAPLKYMLENKEKTIVAVTTASLLYNYWDISPWKTVAAGIGLDLLGKAQLPKYLWNGLKMAGTAISNGYDLITGATIKKIFFLTAFTIFGVGYLWRVWGPNLCDSFPEACYKNATQS